ncbi:aminotransferase class V-fold PLP-dependent enzyme [Fulvivirgaceae bacterium BMA10]|uniref:Aminotransferase class V-fold PLP-dependent enzyme n=1 Tax=Splendidivirga corallicola TaxID=3051826 RepID=A0ABT8KPM7_9BACT|nr:aminotransferase class V-fold PLP-dependent enzyme [Fulvivirgaceae bacterium BMA10]
MATNHLPNTAFISPYSENHKEIAVLFDQVKEIILAHYANTTERELIPSFQDELLDLFTFPGEGTSNDQLIDDLKKIFSYSANHISPKYIGHMDNAPTTASILGTTSLAALNNNMLGLEMSPVFTRMEHHILKEFADLFKLGDNAGGLMASGGSLTNLHAMTIARNYKLNLPDGDLTRLNAKPILFTSELAHNSIVKNANVLGLGAANVEKIAINEQGEMSVEQLEERIRYHFEKGHRPFLVVATLGTTIAGSIDPIKDIAKLCQRYDLWLHADAVYGGAAILSEKYAHLLDGIERADSVTFNAQKWMSVAKTSSMLFLKEYKKYINFFRMEMPYYSNDSQHYNSLGEISIQGSRSTDILKLWLSLRHLGRTNYARLIDKTFELAFYLEKMIDERDYLIKFADAKTNSVLFRIRNGYIKDSVKTLQQYILKKGYYFSIQTIKGEQWLKYLALNPYTDEEILNKAINCIDEFYEAQRVHRAS